MLSNFNFGTELIDKPNLFWSNPKCSCRERTHCSCRERNRQNILEAALVEEFHYKVLKVLQENPDLSQRELAREVGLSLGKTNYCLRALIEKGFVKASNFRNNQNKVSYVYVLTPRGIDERLRATAFFLKRKMREYEALEKEIEQLRNEIKQTPLAFDAQSEAWVGDGKISKGTY